jgi:hypothetical protein
MSEGPPSASRIPHSAFRAKYLGQALEYLAAQPDIWLTTSDEVADHYRRTVG